LHNKSTNDKIFKTQIITRKPNRPQTNNANLMKSINSPVNARSVTYNNQQTKQ